VLNLFGTTMTSASKPPSRVCPPWWHWRSTSSGSFMPA